MPLLRPIRLGSSPEEAPLRPLVGFRPASLVTCGSSGGIDPHWCKTVLLLPFQGANGSVTSPGMDDVSNVAQGTAIVGGSAHISNLQAPWSIGSGCTSLALDGDHDYITFPDSLCWVFGVGPFTVEGWYYFSTVNSPVDELLIAHWRFGWAFFIENAEIFFRDYIYGDTTHASFTPSAGQWYAIAVDRDDLNVVRIYINGVMVSKTLGYAANISGFAYSPPQQLMVGSLIPGGFAGYDIDGFCGPQRITKGVARYGSDGGYDATAIPFPTQGSAPCPSDDPFYRNTILLLDLDGTNGATTGPGWTDKSFAVRGLIGNEAGAQITTANSKFGSGSYFSTGVNERINLGVSIDWQLGGASSDPWTVEFWVRPTVTNTQDFVFMACNQQFFFWCNHSGNGELEFIGGNSLGNWDVNPVSSGITWTIGQWYAIAVTHDALGVVRLFRDGVILDSVTPVDSGMPNNGFPAFMMNDASAGRCWKGNMDEVRFTKGVCRYNANYTPATVAFPTE